MFLVLFLTITLFSINVVAFDNEGAINIVFKNGRIFFFSIEDIRALKVVPIDDLHSTAYIYRWGPSTQQIVFLRSEMPNFITSFVSAGQRLREDNKYIDRHLQYRWMNLGSDSFLLFNLFMVKNVESRVSHKYFVEKISGNITGYCDGMILVKMELHVTDDVVLYCTKEEVIQLSALLK